MRQAVVLAAGEGQRLKPFTHLKPKVMIPIAGKPILQYVVEALAANGVRRIVMVVGYRKEQVIDFFGSGDWLGVEMSYVTQEKQLGTAHALQQAEGAVDGKFLVLAGDNLIAADTISQFVEQDPDAILVKEQPGFSKYGAIVVTSEDKSVQEIIEEPRVAEAGLVNTGIYSFTEDIFEHLADQVDLTAALGDMIARGHRITALQTEGTWLDAVYPWDILELNDSALGRISAALGGTIEKGVTIKGPVCVGKSIIRSGSYIVGPAAIGENCEIGPDAFIAPSTSIGDNVVISPFAHIKNSVIEDGVEIGSGASIIDSIIGQGSVLGHRFSAGSGEAEVKVEGEHHRVRMGAMLGAYCRIEDGVIAQPGAAVGGHCHIGSLRVISGNIPDGSLVI